MRPQKDQEKEKNQEILRRIQSESEQDKKNRTMDILKGHRPTQKKKPITFLMDSWQQYRTKLKTDFYKIFSKDNKNMLFLTAFLLFSSYVCWRVQEKYDKMRNKAIVTKSFKQKRVEEENQKITKYLNRNEFQPVPIQNEEEQKHNYHFEKDNSEFIFDTKEDLLSAIAKDYKKGKKIDAGYEEQLRQKNMI